MNEQTLITFFKLQGMSDEDINKTLDNIRKLDLMAIQLAQPKYIIDGLRRTKVRISTNEKKKKDKFNELKSQLADALTFGFTPHRNKAALLAGAEDISSNVAGTLIGEALLLSLKPVIYGTKLGRALFLRVTPKVWYDEYGLDDIPVIYDSSKGDALNYLSRHLSRLRDMGIDYSDINLYPISKSPIPKDPIKRQSIQNGNNMAAINSKKTIIVSDDPNKTKNLGFMISHEIDHIKNPTYNDLLQSQDFVRKFFDFTDSELKLTLGDTPRLKITDAEVLARGSLIKDYLGFTSANLQMTSQLLLQAVKNYPKVTNSDNLTKFFSRVKDWEGLTDFINKYATGIVPSIGYYASENDK